MVRVPKGRVYPSRHKGSRSDGGPRASGVSQDVRGGAPYFHIIKNREKVSGITLHFIDEDFDTGNIVYQEKFDITPYETMGSIFNRTNYMISDALIEVLSEIEKDGKLSFQESLEWWSIGNGETLEVDVNSLNLDFIDVTNIKIGSVWPVSVEPGGIHQWGVYGTITVGYLGNKELVVYPDKYDFDIKQIVLDKIKRNAEKYPVDKAYGSAKKYNEL